MLQSVLVTRSNFWGSTDFAAKAFSSGKAVCSFLLPITVLHDKCFGNENGILCNSTNQFINIQISQTCFTAFQPSAISDQFNKAVL